MTEATPDRPRSRWKPMLASGCFGMVLGVSIFVAAVLFAYNFRFKESVRKMAEAQEMKPVQLRADLDWSVRAADEGTLEMGSLAGKPIFLHLWRPECVSCVAEVPGINTLYAEFASKGVAFVAIALDTDGTALDSALGMHDVRFPVYTLADDALPPVFTVYSTPTTFIIDPAGFVVYRHSGAVQWDSPDARAFLEHLSAGA